MTDEEVGIRLNLKGRREAAAGLDDVGDKLDRAGDEAESLGRKSRASAAGVIALGKSGRIAGRAMVYGFGAASAAVIGTGIVLTKLSKDSIAEAREAQKVGAVTRQELMATDHAANVSLKKIGDLSSAISAKVGIDDEEIQSGANLLLMYKRIQNQQGKGNKIYDRAVRAAVNMSAVTGTLATNSKLLGKNLNDPMKAVTGLTKAGVKWTDQQIKQIETYEKQGKLLEAQKIVLGAVEERFGGVAAAQATWGEKAEVSIGNIKERIGAVLVPQLDRVEKWFVTKGTPVINGWMDTFERRGIPQIEKYAGLFVDKGVPAMHDFLDEARPLAESVLPAIATTLGTTRDVVKDLAPKLKSVFDGFNALPDWAKQAIVIGAGGAAVAKRLGAGSLVTSGVGSAISKAKPLPVYVVNNGLDVPSGRGGTPSIAGKVIKYGGVLAIEAAAVSLAAEEMGSYLGNRPIAFPERRNGTYSPAATIRALPSQPVVPGIDPRTGMPTINYNTAYKGYDKLVDKISESDAFARKFGVSLEDANRIMGGDIPRSAEAIRIRIGRAVDRQQDFTRNILGSKAVGDELLGTIGFIARDWHAEIVLDTGTAEARLEAFRSKLDGMGALGLGPSSSTPHRRGGKRPSGRTHTPQAPKLLPGSAGIDPTASRDPIHVHLNVDGRELTQIVVDGLSDRAARL